MRNAVRDTAKLNIQTYGDRILAERPGISLDELDSQLREAFPFKSDSWLREINSYIGKLRFSRSGGWLCKRSHGGVS